MCIRDSLNVTIKNGDPDAPNSVDVKILSSTTDPNTHIQTIVTNYGTLTLDTQTGKMCIRDRES